MRKGWGRGSRRGVRRAARRAANLIRRASQSVVFSTCERTCRVDIHALARRRRLLHHHNMSEPDPIILVRESPKAIEAGLRFASRPIVGQRELLNSWRDQHNKSLTAAALKRDGKVACKPLTEELYAEYAAYRKRIGTSWQPLPPPAGLRELNLVLEDNATASLLTTALNPSPADSLGPLPRTAQGGYIRQPALHGRKLTFVSEGDIWVAELPSDLDISTLIPSDNAGPGEVEKGKSTSEDVEVDVADNDDEASDDGVPAFLAPSRRVLRLHLHTTHHVLPPNSIWRLLPSSLLPKWPAPRVLILQYHGRSNERGFRGLLSRIREDVAALLSS